ncbi:MAG: ribose 5-phosphate isomerase B, partial [Clostridia bacterium]|nr:ribose 5-phosphate isomerase B [Clostridia bacterium]
YDYKNFGTNTTDSCDYPDIAKEVCAAITNGECDKGILICGTGIGMSIAANKVRGIRAAHVTDTFSARMTKEHNDANVICLGERITGIEIALEIVEAYLKATFQGGRHEKRVAKIED